MSRTVPFGSRRALPACCVALAIAGPLAVANPAAADVFSPISLVSAGAVPGSSFYEQAESAGDAAISGDGRYVAFDGAFAGHRGIFRRDLSTGEIVTVAEGDATLPSISESGRYISFTTTARLDERNDTNRAPDVYVRDMNVENDRPCPPFWEESEQGRAECAFTLASSVNGHSQGLAYAYGGNPGEEARLGSIAAGRSAIAADGRRVAFETTAVSNLANPGREGEGLVEAAATPAAEVAVRNLDTKATTLVSVRYDPATGRPKLNASGLDEPVPADPTGIGAVYPSDNFEPASFPPTDGGASISADGSTVAWLGMQVAEQAAVMPGGDEAREPRYTEPLWRRISEGPATATRRVTGGTDPLAPACIESRETTTASPRTLADPCQGPFDPHSQKSGEPGTWTGGTVDQGLGPIDYLPRLSANGMTVAFLSNARDIAFGEELGAAESSSDVYAVNMESGRTRVQALRRLTETLGGTESLILDLGVSPDGQQVAFTTRRIEFPLGSPAYVSEPASIFGALELYDVDLADETLTRVTHGYEGGASEATPGLPTYTASPSFSDDGSLLAFSSNSDNLVYGDGNKASDAFVVSRQRIGSSLTPNEVSPPPPNPTPAPQWRLGVTAQSRSDGGVLLYVLVPGAGTLRAQADAGVRVRTASRARAGARRGRRALARSRAREQVATRLVAGALSAPQGGGVVALPLTLAAAYSALANGRGGLSASVTVTFSAPGRPTLSATLDVTFARRAGAAKHRAHSSRHRRHSRRRARHT